MARRVTPAGRYGIRDARRYEMPDEKQIRRLKSWRLGKFEGSFFLGRGGPLCPPATANTFGVGWAGAEPPTPNPCLHSVSRTTNCHALISRSSNGVAILDVGLPHSPSAAASLIVCRRLPQLHLVPLGIQEPTEPAKLILLDLTNDLCPRIGYLGECLVEIVNNKVEHVALL